MITNNPGAYAAYDQLQRLDGGLVDDIHKWNEDAANRRKEQREIDDAKKKEADAKQKEKDKLWKSASTILKRYDTKSESLNEVIARSLVDAEKQMPELVGIITDETASEEDKLKARMKLDHLKEFPENLKLVTDYMTAEYDDYTSGKYWRDEAYEKRFADGFGGVVIGSDENGLPTVAFRDQDGDEVLDVENIESLKKLQGKTKFTLKVDLDAQAVKAAEEIGERDVTEGLYNSIQTKQIKLDEVAAYAKRSVVNDAGQLTDLAKSAFKSKGITDPTPKDIENFTKEYEELIISKSDYLKKQKYTEPSQPGGSGTTKTPKAVIGDSVTPTEQTWGQFYKNIDTKQNRSVSVQGATIPTIRDIEGENITDLNITSYTYDRNGNMVVDGWHQPTKTVTAQEYEEMKGDQSIKNLLLLETKQDGKRIVAFGEKKKITTCIANENEGAVALGLGTTIQELRNKSFIPQEEQEKTNEANPTKKEYKGLDDDGNPIFE